MPILPPSPTPAFNAGFWQSYVPVAGTQDRTEPPQAATAPRLSYSAQVHGTHADFQRSEDFGRYQAQVRESLSFLADFCRQHRMPDARDIEQDFERFFSNRFGQHHYFDLRAEIVDSVGKQSLDEFCAMIGNEAIDAEKRKTAIRNLSREMTSDADSVVSNLACAAGTLAKATGGLRGKLWELKEETARQVLQHTLSEQFGHDGQYHKHEIHFVHTAWNLLADQFGLKKIPQGTGIRSVAQDSALMQECQDKVAAALTPDRLSYLIAEACQAQFNSRISPNWSQSSGIWNADTSGKIQQTLKGIGEDLGLASEDQLQFNSTERDWSLRQSDLRVSSFLKLEEDFATSTPAYTVRTDPSLIAVDILRTMSDMRLLSEESHPKNYGEWIDKDGVRTAIFVYGDVACIAQISQSATFRQPVWDTPNVDFELITLPDLLQWKAAGNNDGRLPPPAAVRQAIRATDTGQLEAMRARWLDDTESIWQLLQSVGTDEAKDYAMRSLSYLGAACSNEERTDLLARVMRMDMADIVRPLTERWFSDASARVDAIHKVLLREAIPAFHQAMRQQDPKAAVSAWYQPLRESGLLTMVAPRLASVLKGGHTQPPILLDALSTGNVSAVEAVFDVLQDLVKDPGVQAHIKDELPDLLAATDWYNRPGLSDAMEGGYTEAVQAFYRGLRDLLIDPDLAPSIRPPLLKALPDLLAGKRGNSDSGLGYALEEGNAGVLGVFHDLLKDLLDNADIAPHIERTLPHLLAMQLDDSASALPYAMKAGSTTALEALFDIFMDPGITPAILHALPGMLTATDKYGTPGLSHALEHGHTGVIEAVHALLKYLLNEPASAQAIQPILPDLLAARNRDGSSGFSYARGNAHTAAIEAFGTMLADPAIRPHIGDLAMRLSVEEAKRRPVAAVATEGDGPKLSDID